MRMESLNHRQLVAAAPAIGTKEPHKSRSKRYVLVNSMKVVDTLQEIGYMPVEAQQDHHQKRDPHFIRHAITFRHRDWVRDVTKKTEGVPQLLFMNSHNGMRKASLRMGYYRFFCLNGLVVGTDLAHASVRHIGHLAEEVIGATMTLAENVGPLMAQIDSWRLIKLTAKQQLNFARHAAVLRWGEDSAQMYGPGVLLESRRKEDEGNSLWRVMNRVQENAMKGGFNGANSDGRKVRARSLHGISQATHFNAELWSYTASVARGL